MLSVGGKFNSRGSGFVRLVGTVDASLAANLPLGPRAGDTYRVVVAGNFEASPLILPAGSSFNVGDQIQWQLDGSGWLKKDATENIVNDAFSIAWSGDEENAPSRNAVYNKFQAIDSAFAIALGLEEQARIDADGVLQDNIDTVAGDLAQEVINRAAADGTLQDNIDAEALARSGADSTLQDNIDALAMATSTADSTLQDNIDAEQLRAETAEGTLQDNINAEALARSTADSTLQDNIDAEALTRGTADSTLQDNIDAEALARMGADSTLQDNIDAEQLRAETAEGTLQDNIDAEATARGNADTDLSDRIEEIATQTQWQGESIVLRDRPGITYPMNSSNVTAIVAANATTYPAKTVTGAGATENNVLADTLNVYSYSSPLVLNFSAANNGSSWVGIRKIPGLGVSLNAKVVKVELSSDGITYAEADCPSYFDSFYQAGRAYWTDGTFIRYPVNKTNKPFVRITLSGGDSSAYSVNHLKFSGFAGINNLSKYTLNPLGGFEDISPKTFQSDTGDRWVYINSSAGNIGSAAELVHETRLRDFATLVDVTTADVYVAGGFFDGSIGTYARTLSIDAGALLVGPGESIDLQGNWTLNGVPLSSLANDALANYYTKAELNAGQLDNRYFTETELNAGQLDNRYFTEAELNAGQLDSRYFTETELSAGQLDSRYYTETELNAGQLDNRYFTEYELNAGQLDGRYYTEAEMDEKLEFNNNFEMADNITINWRKTMSYDDFVTTGNTIKAVLEAAWSGLNFLTPTTVGTATSGVMFSGVGNEISISSVGGNVTINPNSKFYLVATDDLDYVRWEGGSLANQTFEYLGAFSGSHVFRFISTTGGTATTLRMVHAGGPFTAQATFNSRHPFLLDGLEVKDGGISTAKLDQTLQTLVSTFPTGGSIELYVNSTPTPTSAGERGQMYYSSGYIYSCVNTNTWVRRPVETTW